MISVTPISISATSQSYTVNATERLCKPYCVNSSIQPNVQVNYSIDDTNLVGTTLYVTIKAQGDITYVPKCGNACNPQSKIFTEYFTISFADATNESPVTITQSAGVVKPAYVNCYGVACGISALNVVTITYAPTTTASAKI